mgnify:CR=1 FL=1
MKHNKNKNSLNVLCLHDIDNILIKGNFFLSTLDNSKLLRLFIFNLVVLRDFELLE